VRVYVDDEGPGLPAGETARLFDKFQRGSGEGVIAGSARSCHLPSDHPPHGGSIEAQQRPGGGARFELTLPATEQTP